MVPYTQKFKNLHLWMLIPFLMMELGIALSYWSEFKEKAWSVHIHFWTASIWYLYLVLQPYWATHNNMKRHRTQGIIAMVIAGGVFFTAMSMLHRNLMVADFLIKYPDKAPIKPWFMYGRTITETMQMAGFMIAIVQGIVHRREIENHAWWMAMSAFMVMEPAFGRGVFFTYVGMHMDQFPNINIYPPMFVEQAIINGLIILFAWRFGKLKHPATWLALFVNLAAFLGEPIGRNPAVEEFLRIMIKGGFLPN